MPSRPMWGLPLDQTGRLYASRLLLTAHNLHTQVAPTTAPALHDWTSHVVACVPSLLSVVSVRGSHGAQRLTLAGEGDIHPSRLGVMSPCPMIPPGSSIYNHLMSRGSYNSRKSKSTQPASLLATIYTKRVPSAVSCGSGANVWLDRPLTSMC